MPAAPTPLPIHLDQVPATLAAGGPEGCRVHSPGLHELALPQDTTDHAAGAALTLGVRPEHLRWYRGQGWSAVHIGEDPVIVPARFSLEGSAMGTVRRAVHKLEREGLEVRHFVPGSTPFSDAPDHAALLESLRAIGTKPAATAAPEPPLEPPGESSRFHGLRVGGGSNEAN